VVKVSVAKRGWMVDALGKLEEERKENHNKYQVGSRRVFISDANRGTNLFEIGRQF
jgi:hypothetical protein